MSRIAKQKNRIIGYIEEYGSITVKEAQEHLGIGDPRKRISELREKGYPISDELFITGHFYIFIYSKIN